MGDDIDDSYWVLVLLADDAVSYPVGPDSSTGWSYRNACGHFFYNDRLVITFLLNREHPCAVEAVEKQMHDQSDAKPTGDREQTQDNISDGGPLGVKRMEADAAAVGI